jgi:hypothetical protein
MGDGDAVWKVLGSMWEAPTSQYTQHEWHKSGGGCVWSYKFYYFQNYVHQHITITSWSEHWNTDGAANYAQNLLLLIFGIFPPYFKF